MQPRVPRRRAPAWVSPTHRVVSRGGCSRRPSWSGSPSSLLLRVLAVLLHPLREVAHAAPVGGGGLEGQGARGPGGGSRGQREGHQGREVFHGAGIVSQKAVGPPAAE